MIAFDRPCSGFTAADLINLQAIGRRGCMSRCRWRPLRRPPAGGGGSLLAVRRRRDGAYAGLDLSGRIFARGLRWPTWRSTGAAHEAASSRDRRMTWRATSIMVSAPLPSMSI